MINWKKTAFTIIGLIFCIIPPIVATLHYFPLWIETSTEATISGIGLLLLLISVIPIFKILKKYIKSPAIPFVWFILWIVTDVISNIIFQVENILLIGMISNLIGWIIFKIRDRVYHKTEDKQ